MKPVSYARPADAAGAVAAATQADGATVRYLGGGTNLVDLMKLGVETPDIIVDVTRAGLDQINATAGGVLHIGGGVRNSDLAAHPRVRAAYPLLSQALLAGASPQLRNMATVAGNLLQRTRCRYFQDVASPCNKREPGTGCPARKGDHHNLAILGTSQHCIATHPSDMAVALAALDAEIRLEGGNGAHQMSIEQFYRDPGDHPERDTNIEDRELISGVELPAPPSGRAAYRKVRERASFAFALVSAGAVLDVDDERNITSIRLALGGVAHRPWRAHRAEAMLIGGPADGARLTQAIEAELTAAEPLPGNAYKVRLVKDLAAETLNDLAGGGGIAVKP